MVSQPNPELDNHQSPFDLRQTALYRRWREYKLARYPCSVAEITVPIEAATQLSAGERTAITRACRNTNMAFYTLASGDIADKSMLAGFAQTFGLRHLDSNLCADQDSITSLQVVEGGRGAGYIPYTNRPLNWHTDGYYNRPDRQICGILMHCVRAAAQGGENAYLDPEIAYILLRDENPEFIVALMREDAMTIPANEEGGSEIRAAQAGPVFSVDPSTGRLHMRYTARQRSIVWRQDEVTLAAAAYLQALLVSDSAYILRHRLAPGQGIICNNVLHNRTGFEDKPSGVQQRLLYRARYYDRIDGTDFQSSFPQVL